MNLHLPLAMPDQLIKQRVERRICKSAKGKEPLQVRAITLCLHGHLKLSHRCLEVLLVLSGRIGCQSTGGDDSQQACG